MNAIDWYSNYLFGDDYLVGGDRMVIGILNLLLTGWNLGLACLVVGTFQIIINK